LFKKDNSQIFQNFAKRIDATKSLQLTFGSKKEIHKAIEQPEQPEQPEQTKLPFEENIYLDLPQNIDTIKQT